MDRKPWSFAHDRRVIELAKASKPLEEVVRIMKCTPERIRKDAMRLGVSFKGARKAKRATAAKAQLGKPGPQTRVQSSNRAPNKKRRLRRMIEKCRNNRELLADPATEVA